MLAIIAQLAINGLLTTALIALNAGGVTFVYATTRTFHLAHGVVIVAGGYAFWWAWTVAGWPPSLAVVLAVAISVLIGLAMNEFVYERLRARGTRGLGYLIATLALLTLGTGVIMLVFGAAPKSFQFQTPTFFWGDVGITALQLWTLGISCALLGLFYFITHATRLGKAMRATADNEAVAEVLGIDTGNIRRVAFLLASCLAAAVGILSGLEFNLDPNMTVIFAVFGFAAATLGGAGNFGGAILGAVIIGAAEQAVVWYLGSGWRNASVFVVLFLVLLFFPRGLFGKRRDA